MDKKRYSEWLNASFGIQYIEMLLLPEVQGLGILDIELLEELPELKIGSQLEDDLPKIARHIMLSKLWVIGTYETIRVIKKMTENKDILKKPIIETIEKALRLFEKIRVPLAKFEKKGGKERIYSGIADSFIDPLKGAGWNVYEHHKKELKKDTFYRNELGNVFLDLLNKITQDIRAKP